MPPNDDGSFDILDRGPLAALDRALLSRGADRVRASYNYGVRQDVIRFQVTAEVVGVVVRRGSSKPVVHLYDTREDATSVEDWYVQRNWKRISMAGKSMNAFEAPA